MEQRTFVQKVEVFFFKLGVGVGLTTVVFVGFAALAAFLEDGRANDGATNRSVIEQQN